MKNTRPIQSVPRSSLSAARSAFSLIELLTVVGIIAVLAALVAAGIGPVRRMADESRCATNLRTLGQLAQMQSADNGGYVPQAMWDSTNTNAKPNLRDYGLTNEGLVCPAVLVGRSYGINIKLIAGSNNEGQWGAGDIQYWKRGRYPYSELDPVKAMLFTETTQYYSGDTLSALQFRHNGYVNAVFADGHVERFSMADLTRDEEDKEGKRFWTKGITSY